MKIILLSIIICFIYKIITKINLKRQIEKEALIIPKFSFFTFNNQPFTNDSLKMNKASIFIYFNTDCEHCQYEAREICKNLKIIKECNILFISSQSWKDLQQFDCIYNLTKHPNIKILRDSSDNFVKVFGSSIIPSLYLYDTNSNLIIKYSGEVNINNVILQLNKKS